VQIVETVSNFIDRKVWAGNCNTAT